MYLVMMFMWVDVELSALRWLGGREKERLACERSVMRGYLSAVKCKWLV